MAFTLSMEVAESFVAHSDGAVTLVRAWLTHLSGPYDRFKGYIAVCITGERGDLSGEGLFTCVDANEKLIIPEIPVSLAPPEQNSDFRWVALQAEVVFPDVGDYFFLFRFRGQEVRRRFWVPAEEQ